MRQLHMAGIGFLLAGCATAMDVGLPDGSTGYSLNCSGQALSWGACLKKAGQLCKGRGHDIVARDERSGRVTTLTASEYRLFGSSAPVTTREMVVRCR